MPPATSLWWTGPTTPTAPGEPPGAEHLPAARHGGVRLLSSVWADPLSFKLLSALADAGTAALRACTLDRRHLPAVAWLYALLPLGAIESAGSGHLELLAIFCLVLAIHSWDRRRTGALWAGLGALLKLLPGVASSRSCVAPPNVAWAVLVGHWTGTPPFLSWPALFRARHLRPPLVVQRQHPPAGGRCWRVRRPLLMGLGDHHGSRTVAAHGSRRGRAVAGGAFVLLPPCTPGTSHGPGFPRSSAASAPGRSSLR